MPALAVADALAQRGASVFFVGGDRAERELVAEAGYELERLAVSGLDRRNPLKAARALAQSALATARAGALLRRRGTAAVLGAGGYVAGPVGLAAVALRIPLVLSEADSHLGLANRALAPLARRVCLAFPLAGRTGPRYLVTGRAVPPLRADRASARRALGVSGEEALVLVFGGSLGARSINEAALAGLDGGAFRVLHVTGRRDWPELARRAHGPRYELREYLSPPDFDAALAACDLVVARAGGSIFEVAAHGRPAILVPYPHATADHQSANAAWMADAGAALVIPDAELDAASLAGEVGRLLADAPRRAAMSRAALSLARPDAAAAIAGELLAACSGRRGEDAT
ncbi:MAG TPA: UDP-N-acetylglucosamine--N-acetylmuramyl-(pentapeptide) pyrophosphoryl-undecaprenol N-acetylglucosamine transferase [Solirubrobacteraceae bacterium]|nr:UDP-N-acetylglucosamine--N-acetylmuramyl-(pentapeptide) pyrophosphoryl-undecaprenol N-acetylglucosamine transferase [Solirubrobacteraceae bacterium]